MYTNLDEYISRTSVFCSYTDRVSHLSQIWDFFNLLEFCSWLALILDLDCIVSQTFMSFDHSSSFNRDLSFPRPISDISVLEFSDQWEDKNVWLWSAEVSSVAVGDIRFDQISTEASNLKLGVCSSLSAPMSPPASPLLQVAGRVKLNINCLILSLMIFNPARTDCIIAP